MLNSIISMMDRVEPAFAILVFLLVFSMNSVIVYFLAILYCAPERPQKAVVLLNTYHLVERIL